MARSRSQSRYHKKNPNLKTGGLDGFSSHTKTVFLVFAKGNTYSFKAKLQNHPTTPHKPFSEILIVLEAIVFSVSGPEDNSM